ncbi:Predicted sugar transporter [Plasmopara halstedii]|uniref:Predicted sugar transporter n=1 Tax=Plasmopara halstedii TaxID=4781 RepID=A0A0P1ATG8_PLAHL|nr:Predicted sugar transporter [Plasmopara halstedii]CEG45370.1 Predicted sugar transporter [Plasmopara halstedii]|eukprot:XP_024581739.1 Predicted sugar transporter [Plasmopara halstedii]
MTNIKWTPMRYLAYGVGHVLNDMCASTWFSYLLVFLLHAVGMSPVDSAIVMFCGQIADGLATPLVGVFSDKSSGLPWLGLGRRKLWLAIGSVLVILCFFFVFGACVPRWFSASPSRTVMLVYYSVAASIFNVGWATVQVSHMALVPELSNDDNVRCILNSTRYAFTILSNVMVFCAFLVLLKFVEPFGEPDAEKFTLLAYLSLIIGGMSTVAFLAGTPEKMKGFAKEINASDILATSPVVADLEGQGPNTYNSEESIYAQNMEVVKSDMPYDHMTWRCWFKVGMFYQVGLVYMCTRLVVNITQVFISFYLIVTLQMSAMSIAIVPLLVYLSGFTATFFLRYLNESLGRMGSFALGAGLIVVALVLSYFLAPETAKWIYLFSIVLGMGNSIIMVTSVCLTGDLVGKNVESGAFVYGSMSFTDKISNGMIILIIQNMRQHLQDYPEKDGELLRQVYCILPSLAAFVGLCTVVFMTHCERSSGMRRRNAKSASSSTSDELDTFLVHSPPKLDGYGSVQQ